MFETKIKNNVVLILDPDKKAWVSYPNWGPQEFAMWKANTAELLTQCDRMFQKLMIIGENWGRRRN